MALTKTSTYGANVTTSSTTTAVTATIGTASLIVLEWICENGLTGNLDAATAITTSGAAIAFTKIADTHGGTDQTRCRCAMYAAYSDGTAGSRTFTHNRVTAATDNRRMIVHVIEGAQATLATAIPTGNRKTIAVNTNNASISFTPAGAGSMIIGSIADWNAVNSSSWTPNAGNTLSNGAGVAGASYWTAACEPTTNPLATGSAFTWGASVASGSAFAAAAVEIVPGAAAALTAPPPPLIIPVSMLVNKFKPWFRQILQNFDLPPQGPAAYVMPADVGTLTLAGQAAKTGFGHVLAATSGTLTIAGQDAALRVSRKVPAGLGTLTLSGQVTGLRATRTMTAGQGTLTLSGQTVATKYGHNLVAGLGTLTLAGQTATLKRSYAMPAGLGTINMAGVVVNLVYSGGGAKTLPAGVGIISLSGQAVTLRYAHKTIAGLGTLTLSGQTVGVRASHIPLTAGLGTLTLSGQSVITRYGHHVIAGLGTLTLSGQVAALKRTTVMPAGTGSINLSGRLVNLIYSNAGRYTLPASLGVINLSGQVVTLRRARNMPSSFGTLTLSGQAVTTRFAHKMPIAPGSIVLAGQSANLIYHARQVYVLSAGTGVLALSGNRANLVQKSQPGVFTFGHRVTIPNRW